MVNFAAFGCTISSTSRPDLSFHKIPSDKNKVLHQKWLHNIRCTGNLPKIQVFIFVQNTLKKTDLNVISRYVTTDLYTFNFFILEPIKQTATDSFATNIT